MHLTIMFGIYYVVTIKSIVDRNRDEKKIIFQGLDFGLCN